MESENDVDSLLHAALGDENYIVFEAFLESVTEEEWLDAAEEGFSMMLDEYEEAVIECDIGVDFFEAMESSDFKGGVKYKSAAKETKAIFKRFKKEIREARKDMKKCERAKDYEGAAKAAQKAADISKSMLQECDAIPSDAKGAVLAWIGFIVAEVVVAAVVMTIFGTVNGIRKDLPREVDKAYYRTIRTTTTKSAKDAVKGKIAKKLKLDKVKPQQMRNVKDAARVAMRPSNAIKVAKERGADFVKDKALNAAGLSKLTSKNNTANKLGNIVAKNGTDAAFKNVGKVVSGTLNGKGAKEGRAVGGAIVGGVAGLKAAKKISKTVSLLFKKGALSNKGDIDGANISANDFHPLIAAMKNDITVAIKRYEAYAKMYRQRGKTASIKGEPEDDDSKPANESFIFKNTTQSWLFS